MAPQPNQGGGGVGQTHKGHRGIVRHPDDVGPQSADGVGQQHLFGQAEGEDGYPLLDLGQGIAVLVDVELGRHIPVFHDGAGDQLGEHHHIGAEVDDVFLGGHVPAVDVDGVGQSLEGVEADAQGQDADPLDGGKACPQQGVGAFQHKVCVFEVKQHPQAAHQGHPQQHFPGDGAGVKPAQPQAAQVVDEDQPQHHREKPHLAPAVEHQAADEQDGVFGFGGGDIVGRQGKRQKMKQEDDGTE